MNIAAKLVTAEMSMSRADYRQSPDGFTDPASVTPPHLGLSDVHLLRCLCRLPGRPFIPPGLLQLLRDVRQLCLQLLSTVCPLLQLRGLLLRLAELAVHLRHLLASCPQLLLGLVACRSLLLCRCQLLLQLLQLLLGRRRILLCMLQLICQDVSLAKLLQLLLGCRQLPLLLVQLCARGLELLLQLAGLCLSTDISSVRCGQACDKLT